MNKTLLLDVIKSEIERTTGCTDPGAMCLAVARATEELGQMPERIEVIVSPNVYKNGVNVGVPGTGKRGFPIAAALGAVIRHSERSLAILEDVTAEHLARAEQLVREQRVAVRYTRDAPDPLYIRADVRAGIHRASATIAGDYSTIVEVTHDSPVTFATSQQLQTASHNAFADCDLRELIELTFQAEVGELQFLLDAANVNRQATETGMSTKLGAALHRQMVNLPAPFSAMELRDCGRVRPAKRVCPECACQSSRLPEVVITASLIFWDRLPLRKRWALQRNNSHAPSRLVPR